MLQYIGWLHYFQRLLASEKYWLVPFSYRTTTAHKRFLNGCIPIRCFRAGATGCHWFRQSGQEFYQSRWRTVTGRPYDCILYCSFAQPQQPLPASRKSTRTSLRHYIVRTPASVLRARHLDSCPIYNTRSCSQHLVLMLVQVKSSAAWRFVCMVAS